MKIDASNAYFSVQQAQTQRPTNEQPPLSSPSSLSPEVSVSVHEQTLITEGCAKLEALETSNVFDVASIRQQMLNGEINFDMNALASALVNFG